MRFQNAETGGSSRSALVKPLSPNRSAKDADITGNVGDDSEDERNSLDGKGAVYMCAKLGLLELVVENVFEIWPIDAELACRTVRYLFGRS